MLAPILAGKARGRTLLIVEEGCCRDSFFNDLQTRGECLRPPKSSKTALFVDRIVDRKYPPQTSMPLRQCLIRPLSLMCTQLFFPQRVLLHHYEEDGNQDQDMNGRGNHATHDWRGDGLHHIGSDAGLPKDWNKTYQHGSDGHRLGPQAVNSAFNSGAFYIRVCIPFFRSGFPCVPGSGASTQNK